ncbi:two-component response regulator ARR14 [Manihot esculenta]|uniref:Response regulatory domain-containing protein n=1 Tax=Manihot esculenta TaxID=3983 RepID=A0A2C9WQJ9_MANES|nr:two-component response regulator ARR14 [Manihot esculenta]XP_043805611.1 two-component response regulator ARR14 [Manihot esculenta]
MINPKVVSVDTRDNTEPGATGISILVVDCDTTCLTIASKMLHTFGYKVMTATRATDALSILQERQHELDLVLTEVHLPDMDKYELLETMGEISCLPIVVLSADNNENAMLGCLFKGAVFYLLKPITMNDVKSLWQFSYMKTPGEIAPSGGSKCFQEESPENGSIEASECLSFSDAWEQIAQKGKRKELEDIDKDKGDDSVKSTVPKKPKLIWTNELHDRFLQAIRILGIDSAHPKKILKHMNVPGLKKENISSHLQKYRLSLKREQDAIQKTMLRDYHLSSFNLQRENSQFLKPQFLTTTQPEISSHVQNLKNPDGTMCLASLGCANYPMRDSSNQGYNSISKSGEPVPQNEHTYSTHTSFSNVGIRINNEFGQMGNDNGEEFLMLSDEENSRFENATDGMEFLGNWSEQQQQFQEPPLSPAPLRLEQEEGEDILWAERGTSDLFDSADWSA